MTLEGTVVNGQVVFPGAPKLPEGFVVRAVLTDPDDELEAGLANVPPPPLTETYEEHLAILRQSIAEVRAGQRGYSVGEMMARVDAELARLAAEEAK
jgi:hypothetical protein